MESTVGCGEHIRRETIGRVHGGETKETTERLGRERRTCEVEVSTRKSGQVDKWDENIQKRTKKRKRKLVEHATGGQTTVETWPPR
jgi:hypothetical protein